MSDYLIIATPQFLEALGVVAISFNLCTPVENPFSLNTHGLKQSSLEEGKLIHPASNTILFPSG